MKNVIEDNVNAKMMHSEIRQKDLKTLKELLPDDWLHSIMTMYVGSISHNLYVPKTDLDSIDDRDIMMVVIPSLDHFFGLSNYGSRGTKVVRHEELDIVIYEIRKYFSLLLKGNPNVISTLWLRPEDYLEVTTIGQEILKRKEIFMGSHIAKHFYGYALGQFRRMTHLAFQGYMGKKRKELVAKFGWDCKNGSHLIRLLTMLQEFLQTNTLIPFRTHDRDKLLAIKRGEWTLEQVEREAERLIAGCREAEKGYVGMEKPNFNSVNHLCRELVKLAFGFDDYGGSIE